MSVHYLKGTKPELIWCLLYSRMLTTTLIFTMYSGVANLLSSIGCELSMTKFVNWLKRNGRFSIIILKGFSSDLWNQLIDGLELLCKDWQKTEKTSRQVLEDEIPFLESCQKNREKYA